jgi:hypothetical protein
VAGFHKHGNDGQDSPTTFCTIYATDKASFDELKLHFKHVHFKSKYNKKNIPVT